MIIVKECYECGGLFNIPEPEVQEGIVARPIDEEGKAFIEIWLCDTCRQDAIEGGTVCREDIDIVATDNDRIDP